MQGHSRNQSTCAGLPDSTPLFPVNRTMLCANLWETSIKAFWRRFLASKSSRSSCSGEAGPGEL
jgi:hypothetical protein